MPVHRRLLCGVPFAASVLSWALGVGLLVGCSSTGRLATGRDGGLPSAASAPIVNGGSSAPRRFPDARSAQEIVQFPIKEPTALPLGFAPDGVAVTTDAKGRHSVVLFYVYASATTRPPVLTVVESLEPFSGTPQVAEEVHAASIAGTSGTVYHLPSAAAEAEVLTWRSPDRSFTLTLTGLGQDPACVADCARRLAERELIGIARSINADNCGFEVF